MEKLPIYEIPDDIKSLEFDDDVAQLDKFMAFAKEARYDENSYIEAFIAMIQMEEAANSKRLRYYDLENVKLNLYSRVDQVFQIKFDVSIIFSYFSFKVRIENMYYIV